jgi:hypothetical protein
MTRPLHPLAAVPILAIVAIVGLFVWGFIKTAPEPFALPPTMPAVTPIDALGATNPTVHEVVVMNWPTGVPAATYGVLLTDTPGVPFCPVKVGEICEIPPPPVVVPTTVIALCTTETIATFVPGEICRWSDVTETPMPTIQGVWK